MNIEQKTKKTSVIVELHEFIGYGADCWSHQYKHFVDCLRDKVQDIIAEEVEYMQVTDYCIVAHTDCSVTFEVEWYQE